MSTRAQIVCADRNGKLALSKIYKHCDGYPSAVLPTLTTFSQEFCEGRGDDPEYMLAQAVRYFALTDSGEYVPTNGHFTGWGIGTGWHGDIDYLYVMHGYSGRVDTYAVGDINQADDDALPTSGLRKLDGEELER
jgi:hypothetical protein